MCAHRANRRDFLQGRAAVDSLAELAQRALDREHESDLATAPYRLHLARRAMACEFEIILNAGVHADAAELAVAALDRIDELEAQLTVYRDTSELAAINRQATQGPVAVEARLFELLELAVRLSAETGGAFDVTAGPLTKAWGFFSRRGAVPETADLERALASVGSQYLKLDSQQRTIQFERPDMDINLGAIGKGYALDRAAELLDAAGLTSYLLHGGQSSVLARGGQAGDGNASGAWTIGLGDPTRPGRQLARIDLVNQSLATSGSRMQSFRAGGQRYGHILDPRTGQPALGVLTATVIAPSAAIADAVSTAFFVMGVDGATEFCRSHAEIGAVLVTAGGRGKRDVHILGLANSQVRLASHDAANQTTQHADD
ncbi:MAG: FAD:protein FMN transferase [Pirellulales bacterium]|nr:FAD:protein FMN transferase [Pirellulales bacterium]